MVNTQNRESKRVNISGGCHCGEVSFVANVPEKATSIRCNCSVCSMTGYQHLNVPHEHFQLLRGSDILSEYRFGSGQAQHYFCSQCGIKSFYQPRSHPNAYSINLACCSDIDKLQIEIIDFDGQNWEASVAQIQKE